MTSLHADPGFARVAGHLEALGAGAFALYKPSCFDRRLATRLRARGRATLADYAALPLQVLDRSERIYRKAP